MKSGIQNDPPDNRPFRPKRSLGQNFLYDPEILSRIVAVSRTGPNDRVLEIGAGPGTLTLALSRAAAAVTALEIDRRLEETLRRNLRDAANATLLFEDILCADLGQLHRRHLGGGPFRVVANLPYYVTTPILMRLLESGLPILSVTVMVQKEVAERICARPGGRDYGVLSVMVQLLTEPELVEIVPASAFRPRPKVDSAVLNLTARPICPVDIPSPVFFRKVVQAAFSQRRKQLQNSLSSGLGLSREASRQAILAAGLDPAARAETLGLDAFAALARSIDAAWAGYIHI